MSTSDDSICFESHDESGFTIETHDEPSYISMIKSRIKYLDDQIQNDAGILLVGYLVIAAGIVVASSTIFTKPVMALEAAGILTLAVEMIVWVITGKCQITKIVASNRLKQFWHCKLALVTCLDHHMKPEAA